jgi:hypothetical protein
MGSSGQTKSPLHEHGFLRIRAHRPFTYPLSLALPASFLVFHPNASILVHPHIHCDVNHVYYWLFLGRRSISVRSESIRIGHRSIVADRKCLRRRLSEPGSI